MKTDFKTYKRKIDIYVKDIDDGIFYYTCSTNASPTCKDAKSTYCAKYAIGKHRVKTSFCTPKL